jgi:hypothetical protein
MKVLRSFLAVFLFFLSFLSLAFSQTIANSSVSFPLAFEVNRGQTASQVTYLARSREGTIFLSKDGATVAIAGEGSFRLRLEGASIPGAIVPEQDLHSRSNYLGGKQRFSGIENYSAVLYHGVYPGIDVRFYGREQHLEHDFLLTRGADPDTITLALEGIDKLRINDDGVVEFKLGALYLNESAPVAWQTIAGKRISVPIKWRLLGKNRLAFNIGEYDRSQSLTIDPVLAFSTHLGGATAQLQTDFGIKTAAGQTVATAVATDAAGNIYVAGATSAVDFPLTSGSYDHTPKFPFFGGHDPDISTGMGFVSKFDKTGQTLIYSTYLRDVGIKYLAVDGAGHAYALSDIAGDLAGGDGVFVDKLNTDGASLLYSFTFGAAPSTCLGAAGGNASASGIAVDDAGNAWIAGTTPNLCLPTTPGAFQTVAPNKLQAGFAAKLDTNKAGAASIVYSTYLGGSMSDFLKAFAVDGLGNAYLIGSPSADFPHSAVLGTNGPATFISKLSADGSRLLFSTFLQGGLGQAIAVDSSSNVYMSGYTLSNVFPTTANALRTKPTGLCDSNGVSAGTAGPCSDAFVIKLNSTGDALVYSTLLGGSGVDFAQAMRVNAAGQAFVIGPTSSPDFPLTPDAFRKNLSSLNTSYLTVLAPDGGSISYSTLMNGWSNGVNLDSAGNPYVVGFTFDWAFPVTQNAFQPGLKGFDDGFLFKIDMAVALPGTDTIPPVVTLNSPRDGSTITGRLITSGTASDNVAVLGVRFTLDNKDVAPEIVRQPYSATFDSTTFPNGQHTLNMLARDAAGNVSSQSVRVVINNPVDFSLSVSGGTPSSISVPAGGFARYELLARTISGLPGVLSLSCKGLPAGAQCSFLPRTIDLSIDGGSESVFISTTAPTAASTFTISGSRSPLSFMAGTWLALSGVVLAGWFLFSQKACRRTRPIFAEAALFFLVLAHGWLWRRGRQQHHGTISNTHANVLCNSNAAGHVHHYSSSLRDGGDPDIGFATDR